MMERFFSWPWRNKLPWGGEGHKASRSPRLQGYNHNDLTAMISGQLVNSEEDSEPQVRSGLTDTFITDRIKPDLGSTETVRREVYVVLSHQVYGVVLHRNRHLTHMHTRELSHSTQLGFLRSRLGPRWLWWEDRMCGRNGSGSEKQTCCYPQLWNFLVLGSWGRNLILWDSVSSSEKWVGY